MWHVEYSAVDREVMWVIVRSSSIVNGILVGLVIVGESCGICGLDEVVWILNGIPRLFNAELGASGIVAVYTFIFYLPAKIVARERHKFMLVCLCSLLSIFLDA